MAMNHDGTLIFLVIEGSPGEQPEVLQVGCVAIKVRDFETGGTPFTEFASDVAPIGELTYTLENTLRFLELDYPAVCRSPPLGKVAAVLLAFIRELSQDSPVYLVAHRGSSFHFRVLGKCLERVGIRIDVVTVDSLKIFRQLLPGERCGLKDLHMRYFGVVPPGRYNALSDARSLLKCCQQRAIDFVAAMPAFFEHGLD